MADNSMQLLESLGLDVLTKRAPRAAPLAMEYVRDLTAEDVSRAAELPALTEQSALRGVSTKHHTAAQLIASGEKQTAVAAMLGLSQSRLSTLCSQDPEFMQLVEYYRSQGEARYLNVHERLGALGMQAVDELQYRLENAPADVSTREVREILEAAMDRSIAPSKKGGSSGNAAPAAGAVQVNISFPGADAATARPTIDIAANRAEES